MSSRQTGRRRSTTTRTRIRNSFLFVVVALAEMMIAVPQAQADPVTQPAEVGTTEAAGTEAKGSEQQTGDGTTGAGSTDSSEPTTDPLQRSSSTAGVDPQPDWTPLSLSVSPVASGTYTIQSSLAASQVIDVPSASTQAGTGMQLWQSNGTNAQKFVVTCADDGLCSIKNTGSGLYLEVKGASATNSTIVIQSASTLAPSQKWRFIQNTDGSMTIESALKTGLVLDARSGYSTNGTAIQIYTSNGTNAQKWRMITLSTTVGPVASGTYTIQSSLAASQVIDVPSASTAQGVGLQLWQTNGTDAQIFQVTCGQDGWCSIKNKHSGLVLDVKSASTSNGTIVWQYPSNGTNAQKWRFIQNADGSTTIESALKTGLVLDAKGGYSANGTALQVYTSNGTNAQKWRMITISTGAPAPTVQVPSTRVLDDGVYIFSSQLSRNLVVDVPSASTSSGVGLQIYAANQTIAQSFTITWVSGYYQITSAVASQAIVPAKGATTVGTRVSQDQTVGGDALFWVINKNSDSTYTIQSKQSGLVWDVKSGVAASGTAVQMYTPNGTAAQKWAISLVPTQVLKNGTYYTFSTPNGNTIDITSNAAANGTRIWLYTPNGTNAQKWKAIARSDNMTTLVGGTYDKAMDVAGASTTNGTAIQEYDQNGTLAQSWILVPSGDGWYYLQNGLGTYVTYSSDTSGTALTTTQDKSKAGKFNLTSTTGITPSTSQSAIVTKIKQIAWPDRTHSLYDPRPEYKSALASAGLSTYPDQYARIGASCDSFVATVMRSTGLDKNYQCCGAGNQMNYLRSHPEKYQRITNLQNTSNLLPGDIFVSSQHTLFYIGNGQEASASYAQRTASYGYSISFKDSQGTPFEIYRYIG